MTTDAAANKATLRENTVESAIALDLADIAAGEAPHFTADAVLGRYAAGWLANTGPSFASMVKEVLRLRAELAAAKAEIRELRTHDREGLL